MSTRRQDNVTRQRVFVRERRLSDLIVFADRPAG
jgi:hypothetical protein